ncbi:MAG: hypothetical protein ABW082_10370 [Sedimenticola sp.]
MTLIKSAAGLRGGVHPVHAPLSHILVLRDIRPSLAMRRSCASLGSGFLLRSTSCIPAVVRILAPAAYDRHGWRKCR